MLQSSGSSAVLWQWNGVCQPLLLLLLPRNEQVQQCVDEQLVPESGSFCCSTRTVAVCGSVNSVNVSSFRWSLAMSVKGITRQWRRLSRTGYLWLSASESSASRCKKNRRTYFRKKVVRSSSWSNSSHQVLPMQGQSIPSLSLVLLLSPLLQHRFLHKWSLKNRKLINTNSCSSSNPVYLFFVSASAGLFRNSCTYTLPPISLILLVGIAVNILRWCCLPLLSAEEQ